MNNVANWDALQGVIRNKISSLSSEYGATAQVLTQELERELERVERQKRLGFGRLAEALFYSIRVKHQVVRESYITKNLSKLVRKQL